ncbi:manganese and iron superoxide dismutase [Panus rudis PR-1116 ss-1]|nr:manganese and iron superoxide dismutase [Panus rudis PR-1116 ss-1]
MSTLCSRLLASSRAAPRALAFRPLIHSRRIHNLKDLPYDVEEGLGDFLPPPALKMIAIEYQQGLLDRLNDESHLYSKTCTDTEQENKSVVQTVIDTATDPNKVLAFNYASEALNNSFFLESMRPPPNGASSHEAKISTPLAYQIQHQYGSLEQLKSTVGSTALGMFSSGWLWLMCDHRGHLAVYPTFGAGTMLVRSQKVQHPAAKEVYSRVASTPDGGNMGYGSPTSGPSLSTTNPFHPPSPARTFSTSSTALNTSKYIASSIYGEQQANTAVASQGEDARQLGARLFPLFCLSIHEHAWIGAGYGIWGKEEYVRRFWSVLHWDAVSTAFERFAKV